MLIPGHVGITLGTATLLAGVVEIKRGTQITKTSWLTALSRYVDIRLLLVGSLLPDIIDKPVGQYLFRETFNNGRIFSHTLFFLIVISAAGFFIYKRYHQVWMLTLAAGTFMHLILDGMWNTPSTLFWPLMGVTFETIDVEAWISDIFHALLSDPFTYISEAIGLAILLWFGLTLVFRKKMGAFIKYGKVA